MVEYFKRMLVCHHLRTCYRSCHPYSLLGTIKMSYRNPSKNNKGYKRKHHHYTKKLVLDSLNAQQMAAFIGVQEVEAGMASPRRKNNL